MSDRSAYRYHVQTLTEHKSAPREPVEVPLVYYPVGVGDEVPHAVKEAKPVPLDGADDARKIDDEMVPVELRNVIEPPEDIALPYYEGGSSCHAIEECLPEKSLQERDDGAERSRSGPLQRCSFSKLRQYGIWDVTEGGERGLMPRRAACTSLLAVAARRAGH